MVDANKWALHCILVSCTAASCRGEAVCQIIWPIASGPKVVNGLIQCGRQLVPSKCLQEQILQLVWNVASSVNDDRNDAMQIALGITGYEVASLDRLDAASISPAP